jgi:hypothetical protein
MNITKTNKIGITIATKSFLGHNKIIANMRDKDNSNNPEAITLNSKLLMYNHKSKIIRVSKSVIEACKLIDIESIKENIDQSNFDFTSMFILLDNDKSGVIRVERYGSDFSFIMFSDLGIYEDSWGFSYNTYSFITRQFYFEKTDISAKHDIVNYDQSIFVVQLLTYLIFGDITEKLLKPKMTANLGFTRFLNNSKLNITYCDSFWKQRINTEGFKVRGHFRLQPIGEGRLKTKLIWIEQFEKSGYNRKATVELIKSDVAN